MTVLHALQKPRRPTVTDHGNFVGSLAVIDSHYNKCAPVSGRASSAMTGDYQIETCPVDDLDVLVRIRQWP